MTEPSSTQVSGGTSMDQQSDSSAAPSPQSPSSPSSPRSPAATPINVLAWANFGLIVYVWLFTDRLTRVSPLWPMGLIVLNALPGSTLGDVLKTGVVALVNKIPGRDAK